MIQIIDSIMGSGKTTWAINYMNSHPEERFIYVTPYLDEVGRICDACETVAPDDGTKRKSDDFMRLLNNAENIATTHAMLSKIIVDDDLKEHLETFKYHLILDETIEVIHEVEGYNRGDIDHLLKNLIAVDDDTGLVTWVNTEETDIGAYNEIKAMADAGTLVLLQGRMFMWLLPINLFNAMPNITVMTFMFKGSHLHYYLKQYNKEFKIKHVTNGVLAGGEQDLKEIKKTLRSKLHIYEGKLNNIGTADHSLSVNWWSRHPKLAEQVMKNAYNYLHNIRKAKSKDVAWTAFKKTGIKLPCYVNSFVPFNARATNEFGGRTVGAYLVNVYENPNVTQWFGSEQGGQTKVDQDAYALSSMLQWIWRLAIRNGKDIDLFIPSKRMRNLLQNWLDS